MIPFLLLIRSAYCIPVAPGLSNVTGTLIPTSTFDDRSLVASFRTIQEIVWSCLATVFICAWVALHPDVPDPRTSARSRSSQQFFAIIVALLAPEVVAFYAIRDFFKAAEHCRILEKKYPSPGTVI